jgi:uncharacterized membrane protein YfcA
LGNQIFSAICGAISLRIAGIVQSLCLMLLTIATLFYTVKKNTIHPIHIRSASGCVVIGIALGCASSFLGIGGGAIGRKCSKRLSAASVDKLFIGLQLVIVLICLWNTANFL